MQEKSDTSRLFSDRFNRLQKRLNVSAVALCEKVGISRSQFYAIKGGQQVLSDKMDKRLAAIEEAEGIAPPVDRNQHLVDALLQEAPLPELIARLEQIQANQKLTDLEKWDFATYVIPKLRARLNERRATAEE